MPDLAATADTWPEFVPKALDLGFASVHAVPLRLRGNVLALIQDRAASDSAVLRRDARNHNVKLADVDAALVNRTLPAELVLGHAASAGHD